MSRVAKQAMIVHPGGVGVAPSPPQEHEHAARLPPLPTPLQTTLRAFRPLFHATTWLVFLCVLTGLLTGHTTLACVRASLRCADVSWQPCCDFFRRARWSRAAFLVATTRLVVRARYPDGLPA